MYCFFCGKENKEEQFFCKYCGKILHPNITANPEEERKPEKNTDQEQADSDAGLLRILRKEENVPEIEEDFPEIKQEDLEIQNEVRIERGNNANTVFNILVVVIIILGLVLLASGLFLLAYIRSDINDPFAVFEGKKEIADSVLINVDVVDKEEESANSEIAFETQSGEFSTESLAVHDTEDADDESESKADTIDLKEEDDSNELPEDDSEKEAERLKISYVEASSELNVDSKDNSTYFAENILDGDYKTAWIEGVNGNGYEQFIVLHLSGVHEISKIRIFNGYLKTKRRYAINGKVTKALIDYGNGNRQMIDLNILDIPEDEVDFGPEEMGETEVVPNDKYETDTIKITIIDAVAGSKYSDTAISEIEVFGR